MFEIGNTLREARLRRGLDILDCEAETKIRAKYLRAMEEEQFDLMPSPTYVRGFLRTYADFLDLDGRLVLDEYESRFGTYRLSARRAQAAAPGTRTPATAAPRRSASEPPRVAPRRPRRRRRTEVQLLWLAIGGVMTVALLIWLGRGRDGRPVPACPRPERPRGRHRRPPVVAEPDTAATEAPVATKKTVDRARRASAPTAATSRCAARTPRGAWWCSASWRPATRSSSRCSTGIWVRATNPAELKVTIAGKPASLDSSTGGTWLITTTGVKSAG